MRRKLIVAMMLVTMTLLMAGCCMNHEWQDATCITPKTCAKCEKTEGEALGHTWVEASCSAPKTCSVCGETEGEKLEHTWMEASCSAPKTCSVCGETEGEALAHILTEASYQSPAICTVCGETVGEALIPDFLKYGLVCDMEEDVEYVYNTCCYQNTDLKTTGTTYVKNYRIFPADDMHFAQDGYEWRSVELWRKFDDDNAWDYGIKVGGIDTSYYEIVPYADSFTTIDESPKEDRGMYSFTVNWNGQQYTDCMAVEEWIRNDWEDRTCYMMCRYEFLVPVGYDGMVVGSYNKSVPKEDGQYIYDIYNEDVHLFRLD